MALLLRYEPLFDNEIVKYPAFQVRCKNIYELLDFYRIQMQKKIFLSKFHDSINTSNISLSIYSQ